VRSFVLRNHGFAVSAVSNHRDALDAAAMMGPELVMLSWPFRGAEALLDKLYVSCPYAKSMVIAEMLTEAPIGLVAHAILTKGACSLAGVIDQAKILLSGKRGPRKQPPPDRAAAIAWVA